MHDLGLIYEVRIRGHLGETLQTGFPELIAETRDADTVLRGPLRDQAALFGVLAKIEALGLELLHVQRLPPSDQKRKSPDRGDANSPN